VTKSSTNTAAQPIAKNRLRNWYAPTSSHSGQTTVAKLIGDEARERGCNHQQNQTDKLKVPCAAVTVWSESHPGMTVHLSRR
jgi:hypothetical protein